MLRSRRRLALPRLGGMGRAGLVGFFVWAGGPVKARVCQCLAGSFAPNDRQLSVFKTGSCA